MYAQKRKKLPRVFYERSALKVAPDLIGKYIVYNSPQGKSSAKIVEVEAYKGAKDPASHAFRGRTKRNGVMFGPPGHAYVYFIYGMYHCLNFVTEPAGIAGAVLLRAAEPDEGIQLMSTLSFGKRGNDLLRGPGKFCRAFGLTREQNGLDLTGNQLYVEDRSEPATIIRRAERVGLKASDGKLWRFFDGNSKAVSKAR